MGIAAGLTHRQTPLGVIHSTSFKTHSTLSSYSLCTSAIPIIFTHFTNKTHDWEDVTKRPEKKLRFRCSALQIPYYHYKVAIIKKAPKLASRGPISMKSSAFLNYKTMPMLAFALVRSSPQIGLISCIQVSNRILFLSYTVY